MTISYAFKFLTVIILLPLQSLFKCFVFLFQLRNLEVELMLAHSRVTDHLFEFLILRLKLCLLIDMPSNLFILLHVEPLQVIEGQAV